MEFLYSDEGQLLWLKGYRFPIRFDDLNKRNVIPADLAGQAAADRLYAKSLHPHLRSRSTRLKNVITEGWDATIVGATVK